MTDERTIAVNVPDDIVSARQAGRQLAMDFGFSMTDATMIATAISEIARNITSYAGRGEIHLDIDDREGRKALVVRATDDGPGIADVGRALEDGFSSGGGLGLGLPGARRLMDRLEVRSTPSSGTLVEMWKYVPPDRTTPGTPGRAARTARGVTPNA